jgi:hypothetical protein
MISYALATMMLVAASNTAPVRQSYARCLKEFVREGVEKKMEVAAFAAAFDTACATRKPRSRTRRSAPTSPWA